MPALSRETDADGETHFPAVAAGTVWVDATLTDDAGTIRKAPRQRVQLKAGETESVQLPIT